MSTSLTTTRQTAPLGEVERMANAIVQGGLFPALKNPAQALTLMLLCQAKGLHPIEAVERYHIINGKPVKRADAMLSDFIASGGKVDWHQRDDKAASATFTHPAGGSVKVTWTFDQAKAAGLTGKDIWRQYPRQMLHARCVSEGCRSVFPGATDGLYTPEEVENMGPAKVAATVEEPKQEERARAQGADPDRALKIAKRRFVDAANESGHDITDGGKVSPEKAQQLAATVLGAPPTTPEGWEEAARRLLNPPPSVLEGEVMEAVDAPDIADPFAEDAEPGALLSVDPDPVHDPKGRI